MGLAEILGRALIIGVGATVIFDLWGLLLNRVFGTPLPNWALVGRWFCHVPRGKLVHQSIAEALPVAGELRWGWFFHYAVGVLFALVTVVIGGRGWVQAPTSGLPLAVGWITVLCGWLILAPGMGAGIAARLKPNAAQIRILNIAAHTVFGVAMYVIARAMA